VDSHPVVLADWLKVILLSDLVILIKFKDEVCNFLIFWSWSRACN